MNDSEHLFRIWAEQQGWSVMRHGWPDFLCRTPQGLRAVEVKAYGDLVRPNQKAVLDALAAHGLPTFVWHLWPQRLAGVRSADPSLFPLPRDPSTRFVPVPEAVARLASAHPGDRLEYRQLAIGLETWTDDLPEGHE